jgi:hypothetical protein
MKHDPHDRIPEPAVDTAAPVRPEGNVVEPRPRTWVFELNDLAARQTFERAVRDFTVAARRNGHTVEQVIIALKQELARANLPSDRSAASAVVELAVKTCIDQFYQPATSEFPAT